MKPIIQLQLFFLWGSLLFTCIVVLNRGVAAAVSSKQNQPNIVIIVADDLGIGDIGCFGNDTIKTPNIDRIAREGVKLTHHLAAESVCTPSRAALLTGRLPIRSGMAASHRARVSLFVSAVGGLPPEETTFAEVAQRHGYSTAFIGKWHLGVHCSSKGDFCHHPRKQGFDYFYGVPLTNLKDFADDGESVVRSNVPLLAPVCSAVFFGGSALCWFLLKYGIFPKFLVIILLISFLTIPSCLYFSLSNMKMLNSLIMRNFDVVEQPIRFANLSQRLVNEGVQFIEKNSVHQRPFLLMMSWIQVHTALHTSEEFHGHSKHGLYGDNVEEMDWSVGQILASLEKYGNINNTLVYFTSDNGGHIEEKGYHGNQEGGWNGIFRGSKGQGSMDGGIRVPTAAMWPGHIPAGLVVDVPTSQMDIFPTLTEAIFSETVPADHVIDGRNILSQLTNTNSTPPHRFLVHYCGVNIHAARYAPMNGEDVYKLYYATPIWLPGTQGCEDGRICPCDAVTYHDPPLLYNIGRDPSEIHQLSIADYGDVVELINKAVADHKSTIPADIENQFSLFRMIPNPLLHPCCNFPHCTCVDSVSDIK